jgi:hypothetical protein
MIDAVFKGLFMTVVLNFWIWLGNKLWESVEVEEQEDEYKAIILKSITFSDKEKKKE